jgi:hypothetical protein
MFPRSKLRPVRRADNLTTICELIVQTMWDLQDLTTQNGGRVVNPTHRPLSTPQKYNFSLSGTHLC